MSALTGGRPTVGRPESLAQCSRKRRRCQRRTVSGVAITRERLHLAQTLARPTRKSRSVVRSLGRVIVRL
jgi:IS1 family transposase